MMRPFDTMMAVLAVAELTAGCSALSSQPDLTRYYSLTPIESRRPMPVGYDLSVGIGPVTVPDHLEDQLVTRLADEEVVISDTDRWSEPLRDGVSGVLRQNLTRLLGTQRIFIYPWDPKIPPDWAVTLEILQFERTAKGTADLKARWSIGQGSNRAPVVIREAVVSQPIEGTDPRATVSALSAALNNLSQQIAMDIQRVPPFNVSLGR
jgi:uncharacterized lipoprotein YmbA